MNLPNKLSLTRICMIPLFTIAFYFGNEWVWSYLISACIFALAASTDFLDGYIARSQNIVTNLGKFLDPIADKVLCSTAFIVLLTAPYPFTYCMGMGGWIAEGVCVAIILARELIVSGFRMIAAEKKAVLAADMLGKIKTVCQDIAIVCLLFCIPFLFSGDGFGDFVAWTGVIFFFLCTFFTILSGVNYLVKNRQVLKDDDNGTNG